VGLTEFQLHTRRIAQLTAGALDVGKRAGAVNLRLALSEQVQVRAVEDVDRPFVPSASPHLPCHEVPVVAISCCLLSSIQAVLAMGSQRWSLGSQAALRARTLLWTRLRASRTVSQASVSLSSIAISSSSSKRIASSIMSRES